MWAIFFAVTFVAAISFVLAAWMSLQLPDPPRRKNSSSLIGEFAAGCRDLSRAACAAFGAREPVGGDESVQAHNTAGAKLPRLQTTVFRDMTLLPRRMRLLHIDSVDLARDEPLVFRQLIVRCEQCHATEQCAQDLVDDSSDPFGENWRDYCPNASMLSTISTLQGIRAVRGSAVSPPGEWPV
jgi:hypothetical protein